MMIGCDMASVIELSSNSHVVPNDHLGIYIWMGAQGLQCGNLDQFRLRELEPAQRPFVDWIGTIELAKRAADQIQSSTVYVLR